MALPHVLDSSAKIGQKEVYSKNRDPAFSIVLCKKGRTNKSMPSIEEKLLNL